MRSIRNFLFRLAREPAFAIIFILTLALGVGANAALLSALRSYYLAPLPYSHAGRLVNIQQDFQGLKGISVSTYRDVLANTPGLSGGGLGESSRATVEIGNHPRIVETAQVTPSVLHTLGVAPARGRTLSSATGLPDGPREAVLSYEFWQNAYGGAEIAGKTIKVNGNTYNVVGVMPAGFHFPDRGPKIYLPLRVATTDTHDYLHASTGFFVARLAAHTRLAELNTALHARQQEEISRLKPDSRRLAEKNGYKLHAVTLRSTLIGDAGPRLALIECGAALLFILAVAILANLVTTRALGRRHEKALKLALGAGRLTLWRDALRETLPLALLGGASALALAWVGIELLLRYGFGGVGSAFTITLSGWTVLAALVLALAAGFLAALPAALGSASRLLARLAEGGHGTPTRQSRILQRGLSITQIALGVALLTNAGLIGVAYHRLSNRALGFNRAHLVVASLGLHNKRFSDKAKNVAFVRQFTQAAAELPGFEAVGMASAIPFGNTLTSNNVHRSGARADQQIFPAVSYATQGVLRTLGARMLAGRTFRAADLTNKAHVAVIDADLARAMFPSPKAAIGQTIVIHKETMRIIGVTGALRWFPHALGQLTGTLWLPYSLLPAMETGNGVYVTVRTTLPPALATRQLKDLLYRLAPTEAFDWIRPMQQMTARAYRDDQGPAVLVGLFSLIALLLAAIGVYGTVAYLIRQRLGEFAVRRALGATPGQIGLMALTQGALLAVAGIGLGIGGGFLLSRALATATTMSGTASAAVYISTALAMAIIVFATTSIPAQRARRADLLALLRPQ